MATRTFHISFPAEWAQEIEKEMKKDHFTPTEYFKFLYRSHLEGKRVLRDLKESEKDLKEGKYVKASSLSEFM